MHNEFVVEFKDGTRDWVDPVIDVTEDDSTIYVQAAYLYEYKKDLIARWTVRPYHEDTTGLWIGEVK